MVLPYSSNPTLSYPLIIPSQIISSQCRGRYKPPQLEGRGGQSMYWTPAASNFACQTFCIVKSQPHVAWERQETLTVFRARSKFDQLFDFDYANPGASEENFTLWRCLNILLFSCPSLGFNAFTLRCIIKGETAQTHSPVCDWSWLLLL